MRTNAAIIFLDFLCNCGFCHYLFEFNCVFIFCENRVFSSLLLFLLYFIVSWTINPFILARLFFFFCCACSVLFIGWPLTLLFYRNVYSNGICSHLKCAEDVRKFSEITMNVFGVTNIRIVLSSTNGQKWINVDLSKCGENITYIHIQRFCLASAMSMNEFDKTSAKVLHRNSSASESL